MYSQIPFFPYPSLHSYERARAFDCAPGRDRGGGGGRGEPGNQGGKGKAPGRAWKASARSSRSSRGKQPPQTRRSPGSPPATASPEPRRGGGEKRFPHPQKGSLFRGRRRRRLPFHRKRASSPGKAISRQKWILFSSLALLPPFIPSMERAKETRAVASELTPFPFPR